MATAVIDKARTIFVARLPWITSVEVLREYFGKYGNISRTSITFDKDTGRSKCYGFVIFNSDLSVDNALKEPKHVIDGIEVIVNRVTGSRRNEAAVGAKE